VATYLGTERSWDFNLPVLTVSSDPIATSLESSYTVPDHQNRDTIAEKRLEEENNRLFIDGILVDAHLTFPSSDHHGELQFTATAWQAHRRR
jgi:hypothetical protein